MTQTIVIRGTSLTICKNGQIDINSGIALNEKAQHIPIGKSTVGINTIDNCKLVRVKEHIEDKPLETIFFVDYLSARTPYLVMAPQQVYSRVGLIKLVLTNDLLLRDNQNGRHILDELSRVPKTREYLFSLRNGEAAKYNLKSGGNFNVNYTGKDFNCEFTF